MNSKIDMLKKQMKENERYKMLTLQKLKDMLPGEIFATGITTDARLHDGLKIKWIAVRGSIHDWCIYYHKATIPESFIRSNGDKIFTKIIIKDLVPCDDEAYSMYRR